MRKAWTDEAWEEYVHWQTVDKKTLKKIHSILNGFDRDLFSGIGKPEPLKHDKHGYWSRRIDEANRLVYKIENNQMIIVQCGSHYDD